MPKPITDAERARILDLTREGKSRAQIAREVGRSPDAVGRAARQAGHTWDRTKTQAATEAKQADNRARRTTIINRLYGQADAQLDRLDLDTHDLAQPSAGELVQWSAEYLPAADVKALVQAVASATTAAVKLEQVDSDRGADNAKSILGDLAEGLTAAYQQMSETDGDA